MEPLCYRKEWNLTGEVGLPGVSSRVNDANHRQSNGDTSTGKPKTNSAHCSRIGTCNRMVSMAENSNGITAGRITVIDQRSELPENVTLSGFPSLMVPS
jgi:hypothetical protein